MSTLGIDFSAITVERFDFVTQDKKQTYTLNDDLPLDVIVQVLAVRDRYRKLVRMGENDEELTADEAQPLVDDWSESVIDAALAIFRHTPAYADITEAALLASFDVIHLWAIVGFFSKRLFEKSSQQQNATETAESLPNRKARRAATANSRHA